MGSKTTTRVVLRTSTTTTGYYNGHNLVDQEIMEKWLISFQEFTPAGVNLEVLLY